MAFQNQPFDVLAINYEKIIKHCETIKDEALKPAAEVRTICYTLLVVGL